MNTDKHDEKNDRLVNEKIKLEHLSGSTRSINYSQSDTMQKSTKSCTTVNTPSSGVATGLNAETSSIDSRQQKINSAPVLYLNKSQVLVDSSIKISDEKLDSLGEKRVDLEANIIFDNSGNSLKNKSHQSVSDKLKNVGKIITDKFSKTKSSKTNIDTTSNEEDYDDDDYVEMYDENEMTSDLKITELNSNKKIGNAILYEENDEDADEDDNLIMNLHSDVEETTYFVNEAANKQPPLHLQLQQHVNNKKDVMKDVTVPMASPDAPSTSSAYLSNDNTCEKSICETTDATKSNLLLMPADLNFNSSFNSTTSRTSTSNNNNNNSITTNTKQSVTFLQNNQHSGYRNLKKMTTQGSKAMRIMGNNDTMTTSNGPLSKINPSGDANNLKSPSGNNILMNPNATINKKQQKRLFFKNGNINISRSNIDKRRRRYLTDIFTTLIDLKWRYNALVFALGFFVSWIFFAILWYLISYVYGDLEQVNLENKNYTACVAGISSFSGAILFSIETQQTIGYGVRYTTEKCPLAIFVMMLQSSMGVIIQSFMVGVVFAKLSRPKKRSETLMFSKNAVISLRDGRLCLICRVGDMRKSHIVEAHVRMYLIKKKVTLEGEIMPLHMYDLNVGWDKGLDRLFLVWPLTIEHYIDQNSPFWSLSAEDLKKERFEIAVILEGIVESTGMTTQARSSYLVNEILWGHRFEKLITFQKEDGTYKIDYSRFNMTVPVDTPTCSAKDLAELKEQEQFYTEAPNENSNSPSTINSKEIIRAEDAESLPASPSDLRRRKLDTKEENSNTNITYLTNESINKHNSNTIISSNSCENNHGENNQKC